MPPVKIGAEYLHIGDHLFGEGQGEGILVGDGFLHDILLGDQIEQAAGVFHLAAPVKEADLQSLALGRAGVIAAVNRYTYSCNPSAAR